MKIVEKWDAVAVSKELNSAYSPDPVTYQSTLYPSKSNSNAIQIPQQSHPESNNLAVYATNRKGKKMRIMFIRRTSICVLQEGGKKERMGILAQKRVGVGSWGNPKPKDYVYVEKKLND